MLVVSRLKQIAEKLKKKIYAKELQMLEQKKRAYKEEEITLADYYAYLESQHSKLYNQRTQKTATQKSKIGIYLQYTAAVLGLLALVLMVFVFVGRGSGKLIFVMPVLSMVSIGLFAAAVAMPNPTSIISSAFSDYPQFRRFMVVAKLEKEINFEQVEEQRTKLIENLSKILPKPKIKELVEQSVAFRTNKIEPAAFHVYLQDLAEEANISFDRYAELSKYISGHSTITTTTLFKEADKIEERIQQAYAKTEQQQKLKSFAKTLEIIDSFLNLKLVPEDFSYYTKHKNEFFVAEWMSFLKANILKHNIQAGLPADISVLDNNIDTLAEF